MSVEAWAIKLFCRRHKVLMILAWIASYLLTGIHLDLINPDKYWLEARAAFIRLLGLKLWSSRAATPWFGLRTAGRHVVNPASADAGLTTCLPAVRRPNFGVAARLLQSFRPSSRMNAARASSQSLSGLIRSRSMPVNRSDAIHAEIIGLYVVGKAI